MLEEVRKPCFAVGLVGRAYSVPHAHEYGRHGVIGVHEDREPVVEAKHLVRDIHLVGDFIDDLVSVVGQTND